ncbi:hypothetical protein H0E84_15090 [Luteimonas sp. SJ-92]|uniref:Uncharacterized protein n=1 Tax=Luteimonas salinisoli TaxID=2752307 RepID=A0A853JFS8_9GAMM|nr:hypothetical protein [Luteimonas salinisoli]NZA27705.1 hypothetical protein [Luteimonas salinisoli]
MHRFLPLLVLAASCSQAETSGSMSDEAFAQTVLSRAKIGQSLSAAEASLGGLELDCSAVVAKPLPGSVPDLESRTIQCSRPPLPQDQCWQRIELTARKDKIVSISLTFEQLPGSVDGSACGR